MTTFVVVNMRNITPIFPLLPLGFLKNKNKYVYVLYMYRFFRENKSDH